MPSGAIYLANNPHMICYVFASCSRRLRVKDGLTKEKHRGPIYTHTVTNSEWLSWVWSGIVSGKGHVGLLLFWILKERHHTWKWLPWLLRVADSDVDTASGGGEGLKLRLYPKYPNLSNSYTLKCGSGFPGFQLCSPANSDKCPGPTWTSQTHHCYQSLHQMDHLLM